MTVRSLSVLVSVLVAIAGSPVAAQVVEKRPAAFNVYALSFQDNNPATVWIIATVPVDPCNHYAISGGFRKLETPFIIGDQDFFADVVISQTLMGCPGAKPRPAQVLKSATLIIHPDRSGRIRSRIYVPPGFELIVGSRN
jgi:hypothetical protein